jgi:hypothetical protein
MLEKGHPLDDVARRYLRDIFPGASVVEADQRSFVLALPDGRRIEIVPANEWSQYDQLYPA